MASPVSSISMARARPTDQRDPRASSGRAPSGNEGFGAVFEDARSSKVAEHDASAGAAPKVQAPSKPTAEVSSNHDIDAPEEPVDDAKPEGEPDPIASRRVAPLEVLPTNEIEARDEAEHSDAVLLILANTEPAKALRLMPQVAPPTAECEPQANVSNTPVVAAEASSEPVADEAPPSSGGEMVFRLALNAPPASNAAKAASTAAPKGENASPSDQVLTKPASPLADLLIIRDKPSREEGSAPDKQSTPERPTVEIRVNHSPEAVLFAHASESSSSSSVESSNEVQTTRTGSTHPMDKVVAEPIKLPVSSMLQRIGIVVREEAQSVRLDIHQTGGAVKVAVHSDDAALAAQLRASLPELLHRLEDNGLQARVTSLGRAAVAEPARAASSGDASQTSDRDHQAPDANRDQERRNRNPRAWRSAAWKLEEE